MALAARLRELGPWAPAAIVVALALFIAWAFAATTLSLTGSMGLPLDDGYTFLTQARQLGRLEPLSPPTSALWPMLLAPFWVLGARGHALVWVAFGLCAALYALVGVGVVRFVRVVCGDRLCGLAAAVMALAVAPFAWCALAGLEVVLTSALLVATLGLLAETPRAGRPSRRLVACLAATSLSSFPAMLVVVIVVVVAALVRVRRRAWREALWWLVPLVAPVVWWTTSRLVAGHVVPGAGPGWMDVMAQIAELARVLAGGESPLVWPALVLALFVVGAVRVGRWARRERRWLVGVLVIVLPPALLVAGASSGPWQAQNYRHLAPALPFVFIPVGIALAPFGESIAVRRAMHAGAIVVALLFVGAARRDMVDGMKLYAQGVLDIHLQGVTIGRYLRDKRPDAVVMADEPGAIAYYFDGPVRGVPADVAAHGPGARFELLDNLRPERRPSHFAMSPRRAGSTVFFGSTLKNTPLRRAFAPRRLAADGDVQVIESNWDHAGTAERPMNDHTGWAIVDRVDVAHLASERAHGWDGRLGHRSPGDPDGRWSFVERSTASGLHIDGGRTIRDGAERFRVRLDPARPARLVFRTGGQKSYPGHEPIHAPVTLTLFAATKRLGTLTIAPPAGAFSELTFTIPPHTFKAPSGELRTQASGSYRVFHWFVLQPE